MDTEIHTIYTIGYAGWTPSSVKARVEALNAMLLDIRYSPYSKRAEWRGDSLKALLGRARYSHIKTLGNRNYRGDGPIVLDAPEAAVETVTRLLTQRPVVLLCACRDADTCHRSVAAEFLSERLGAPIEHLYPGAGDQRLDLTEAQLAGAAHAWDVGGCLMLGRWLGTWKEGQTGRRGFTTAEYGELVLAVRKHLGDDTDYSQEGA